jgi:uncharacterized protein (DUF58 family)
VKIRRIIIIIPLIILGLALAGGFTWLWRLFIFLVIVLLLNYIWLRLSARAIDGRVIKSSDLCRIGESLEEEFTVYNSSRIPSPLIEAQEETDLPGYRNNVAFNLSSHESRSWRTQAGCRRRGQYSLGILKVKISDPLGFFRTEKRLGEYHEVIVYPEMLELPFFQALPSQEPGHSPRRWLASEAGPIAARIRDYTSGDSYHHIHWPTTAHTGRLMVRDFEPDRSNYNFKSIWIVLDMHRDSRQGEGDDNTEEYAITIAASLAKKHIESGKQVGLMAAGDRSYLCLPETGSQQLQQILLALAVMKAEGQVPLDSLISSQADRFEAGSVIVVIMPSSNQNMVTPLRQAMNRGVIVTAILLDSLSFGGEIGAESAAHKFIASGLQVYVMGRGSKITSALDSRLPFLRGYERYQGNFYSNAGNEKA